MNKVSNPDFWDNLYTENSAKWDLGGPTPILKHHLKNCTNYRTWYIKNNFLHPNNIKRYDEIPFVPSAVFKKVELKSIKNKTKIITSSGSSGQNKSLIAIDNHDSMKNAGDNIFSTREHAACANVQKFFFPKEPVPIWVIYVDNDDLKPDAIWHYRVINKKFYRNPI